MGEIKSAFELAMERSRKMIISEEEREELKQKEIVQKAMSLFHRYSEGLASVSEILREIEKMEDKTRARVKKTLLSKWMDALCLDEVSEKFLKAIESLKGEDLEEIKGKFARLLSQYQEGKEKAKQEIGLRLVRALEREGIHGSAVDPNVEGSEEFKEALSTIERNFKGRLEELKKGIKASS